MSGDVLSNDNFLIYAARHYDNPQCYSTEEFTEDLKRIKYVKKLLTRYSDTGELKERLILNHLIVLANVFGPEHLARIVFLKMRSQLEYIKPFMVFLDIMPEVILNVERECFIDTNDISMDLGIVEALRRL